MTPNKGMTNEEIAKLVEENEKVKKFIAELFYDILGGFYSLEIENAMDGIKEMVLGHMESSKELAKERELSDRLAEALKTIEEHIPVDDGLLCLIHVQDVAYKALKSYKEARK